MTVSLFCTLFPNVVCHFLAQYFVIPRNIFIFATYKH